RVGEHHPGALRRLDKALWLSSGINLRWWECITDIGSPQPKSGHQDPVVEAFEFVHREGVGDDEEPWLSRLRDSSNPEHPARRGRLRGLYAGFGRG
ncbi:hypothetical protein L6R46_25170, partial [Myxococcota bacterium]|nr:hypothetical protein [Myxococcota bacterium]